MDGKAVAVAKRNLELLTVAGLDQRIGEISQLFELYGKDSHKDALSSGHILRNRISALTLEHPIATKVFEADATDSTTILKNINPKSVDIVFTDVPYGQHSHWQSSHSHELLNPIWSMLNTLTSIISSESIVAIVSDKKQKVSHESFQRIEQFQVGKRRVVILRAI
jgi:16S rRNA G966 N2-methylase RsmD